MKKWIVIFLLIVAAGCVNVTIESDDAAQAQGDAQDSAQDTQVPSGQVSWITFEDPTFALKLDHPDSFSVRSVDDDLVFSSTEDDVYYIASILLTRAQGGDFATLLEVQNDYLSQLSAFSPTLLGSEQGTIDGYDAIDFAIGYTADGVDYVNRFVIGMDQNYFYVLQIVVPLTQYEARLGFISAVIESFEFGEGPAASQQEGATTGSTGTTGAQTGTSGADEVSPEECYEEYRLEVEEIREHNAAQDPSIEAGGIFTRTIGKVDACTVAFDSCYAATSDYYATCPPDSDGTYTTCTEKTSQDRIHCAQAEVDCSEEHYKGLCGI